MENMFPTPILHEKIMWDIRFFEKILQTIN